MMDEISQLKRAIASRESVIFVGHDVSIYTNSGVREVGSRSRPSRKLRIRVPDLIQAIGALDCPIITSNLDLLVEEILEKQPLTWKEFLVQKNLNNHILHLYDYHDESRRMSHQASGFNEIFNNEVARLSFRALLDKKTLLFVGYNTETEHLDFYKILQTIFNAIPELQVSVYKLVELTMTPSLFCSTNTFWSQSIREIPFGLTSVDLVSFIDNLRSFTPLSRINEVRLASKERIRIKYLHYLIQTYGHVSVFGYSDRDITLPLQSVFVELKFDPTHPSIKAMKSVEIHEELKRKLRSPGFFTDREIEQLNRAILAKNASNPETIHRDFLMEQWLNVLLSNRKIFNEDQAQAIKNKVDQLKGTILKQNNFNDAKQYSIQQAYQEFRHFIVLGHPGSGKTTLSKWLVTNMAKQCLGEKNLLFDAEFSDQQKLPVLIPIWKYVDRSKDRQDRQRMGLLQFLQEDPTLERAFFTDQDRLELASLMKESLLQGNMMIILEGLDEVPAHTDRADLIKDINEFLEQQIDYDSYSDKLIYSGHARKEIHNTNYGIVGNRCIITSRIEGNYFEEINFYIPRLTIENMSDEALQLFCHSYIQCIQEISTKVESKHGDQLYQHITQNKDIYQLAINPQLASVIAAIYHQYGDKLPENRIDLYEKAIAMMIERVVTMHIDKRKNASDDGYQLNSTTLWSIWQQIAEYLHSRVEGLSEDDLKMIIKTCLLNAHVDPTALVRNHLDESIVELVDIFKYQAGLLNEFGYDSFRFIHRTFQEYLAAKSIIYANGLLRDEDLIYERIHDKIAIPNWRVPLSMTFGILSRSQQHHTLFVNILSRLLQEDQTTVTRQFSSQLVPFVVIDSFSDTHFTSERIEHALIQKLADTLLLDYKNVNGFARLPGHQELIQSYFSKLKVKYDSLLVTWFLEKMQWNENRAPCAHLLLQLKWYHGNFHQVLVQSLPDDSSQWHWPIDSILRFYAKKAVSTDAERLLPFRTALNSNRVLVRRTALKQNWLSLLIVLYGGYANFNIAAAIQEYHELAQFLSLSEHERMAFILYYQETWGQQDPAYNMAVHLDNNFTKNLWKTKPIFDFDNIYKDSCLTDIIFDHLKGGKPTGDLVQGFLREHEQLFANSNNKIDLYLCLISLGQFDLVNQMLQINTEALKMSLRNRIKQVIHSLKDPIARFSSKVSEYLLLLYKTMQRNPSQYQLPFSYYCKIYFSLVVQSGGLPVNPQALVEAVKDPDDQSSLCAEVIANQCTGASDDLRNTIATYLNQRLESPQQYDMVESILKINDAVQLYKPVRAYPWPMDSFIFKIKLNNDLPIPFFNCLENIHPNVGLLVQGICEMLLNQGYFHENPELKTLVALLNFGILSKDIDMSWVRNRLFPELPDSTDMKQFLRAQTQSMSNPYYKARACYQLAQFYDEECFEWLQQSFQLAQRISEPILEFQVLEKIFDVCHYKGITETAFIARILRTLELTATRIVGSYNRIIAQVRLSFYGSGEFRRTYLTTVISLLAEMEESYEKIQLMIKLKPMLRLFHDLRIALERIVQNLKNKTYQYCFHGYYGRVLSAEKLSLTSMNGPEDLNARNVTPFTDLESLFFAFAQLKDMELMLDASTNADQRWINLLENPHDGETLETLIKTGLESEFFLTPQIATVIDECLERGEEEIISALFPCIIKPSNEVIPLIQKWFTSSRHHLTRQFAALLLAEAKHIFAPAVDTLVELLQSEHDQLRYRAQRLFQHPERDVREPSKRLSVLGAKTSVAILRKKYLNESLPRLRAYLSSFFFDFAWDDGEAFARIVDTLLKPSPDGAVEQNETLNLDAVRFATPAVWNVIMQAMASEIPPRLAEQLFHSTMRLVKGAQITDEQWTEFAELLSTKDKSEFKQKVYFVIQDVAAIRFMINEIVAATVDVDQSYFEILQSKLISHATIPVERVSLCTYAEIENLTRCNFHASTSELNRAVLNMVNTISLNMHMFEIFLRWLMEAMVNFQGPHDTLLSLLLCDYLCSIVSACAQKEHYLYRKITNAQTFDKSEYLQLLEKIVHHHPFYAARGSAFILLAALDHSDYKAIVNAMNTLWDENLVKEYTAIGLTLVHLSPNELIDDLLESLNNDSAVKAYELLKIFTQYALDEKIDVKHKSKILCYVSKEIGLLKSKKCVNYNYTDIKIPFTTTLENELYKAWIKIQGLSGKSQYLIDLPSSTTETN